MRPESVPPDSRSLRPRWDRQWRENDRLRQAIHALNRRLADRGSSAGPGHSNSEVAEDVLRLAATAVGRTHRLGFPVKPPASQDAVDLKIIQGLFPSRIIDRLWPGGALTFVPQFMSPFQGVAGHIKRP